MNKFIENLRNNWCKFFLIVFSPLPIIFFSVTIILIVASSKQNNPYIISILSILLSLSTAMLGATIHKKIVDLTEGSIAKSKGHSAIRGLKLLLNNIVSLENRIRQYLSQDQNKKSLNPLVNNFFDEIRFICNLMAEETVNSIENWTDIIPEANLTTQIGIISDLQGKHDAAILEKELLEERLKNTEGESVKENQALKLKIKEKEIEISKLRAQVRDGRISIGSWDSNASSSSSSLSWSQSSSSSSPATSSSSASLIDLLSSPRTSPSKPFGPSLRGAEKINPFLTENDKD